MFVITRLVVPAARLDRPQFGRRLGSAVGTGGVLMGTHDAGDHRDLAVEVVDRLGDGTVPGYRCGAGVVA
ncbi:MULTISPECIES: hypothetical protein [Actinosynnema]|uniref:hypothetical protein n=1 Tax=Actinosynnema TaxID=40566 RepID=UPI0020A257B1|nr:hypothetical protein [Actinosynnema pretiosum]